jgi:hypothetical protein
LNFLALVEETYSGGNPDHAELLLRRAEQTVIEVKQLLPVLSEHQRRGFGPTLNSLQEAVEGSADFCELPRTNTASMF